MRSISFPPGSNNFRLVLIVIVAGFLWVLFLNYTDRISVETERASIQQTQNIINSSLVVAFATFAVKGRLDRLNELDGGNPFVFLAEYQVLPASYRGEIGGEDRTEIESGWYYDQANREVIYKAYYSDQVYVYSIKLDYLDVNKSGRFESDSDDFRKLIFIKKPQR